MIWQEQLTYVVEATIETLEDMHSDSSWDHLHTFTKDVAKLNNVPLLSITTGRPCRSKQLPKQLESGIVLQSTGSREPVSTAEEFKVALYRIRINIGEELNLAKLANSLEIVKFKSCQYFSVPSTQDPSVAATVSQVFGNSVQSLANTGYLASMFIQLLILSNTEHVFT